MEIDVAGFEIGNINLVAVISCSNSYLDFILIFRYFVFILITRMKIFLLQLNWGQEGAVTPPTPAKMARFFTLALFSAEKVLLHCPQPKLASLKFRYSTALEN